MSEPVIHYHSGFLWPLDWFQGIWEGFWDQVKEWIDGVAKMVWDLLPSWLKDPILRLKGWIDGIITWVRDHIGWWDPIQGRFVGGFLGWLWDTLSLIGKMIADAAGWVWEQVEPVVGPIAEGIKGFFDWLWTQIQAGIDWLKSTIWSWVDGSLRWLTDTFKWLQGEIGAIVGDAQTAIITAFDGAFAGITDVFMGWPALLTGAISAIFEPLLISLGAKVVGASPYIAYYPEGVPGWAPVETGWLEGVIGKGLEAGARWILESIQWIAEQIIGLMTAVNEAIAPVLTPILTTVIYKATESLIPTSPPKEVEEALTVFSKKLLERLQAPPLKKGSPIPTLPELLTASAGVIGLSMLTTFGMEATASYLDLAHPVKMTGIMTMAHDLIASLDTPAMIGPILFSNIYAGIIMPLRYRWNEIYTPMIPPIDDLIRFVVREVITPETFYQYGKFHGYSEEHTRWFWDAHWILPAFAYVVDAYHRGAITSEELDKFLVWHDYSPTPRPGIEKTDVEIMRSVLKTLIPRVDLRYAWEMGRLTDEELVEWYERLGYEEDAPLMAEIQMVRSLVEEIHKIRDEWLRDFIEGYTDEATLRANLAAVGIGPMRVEYYSTYAKKRREREQKKKLLDIYEDAYVKDLITDEDLETQAAEILVDERALELFLEATYIRKYKKPKAS